MMPPAKAEAWRKDFGETQVVPAAVISGAYKLTKLEEVQRARALHSLGSQPPGYGGVDREDETGSLYMTRGVGPDRPREHAGDTAPPHVLPLQR